MEARKLSGPSQFPAIVRLAFSGGRKRVPFVRQGEWSDCGAACLAMVLAYRGSEVRLGEVRDALGGGRDGADASSILRVAESYGLRGRGLQLEVEDLRHLSPASILHWDLDHFVVFERCTASGVEIVDPARGRRLVPLTEVRRSFTGVALALEATTSFEPLRDGSNRLGQYFSQLFAERRSVARVVLTSLVLRVFALAVPILTGLIVDRVVPHGDLKLLFVVACGLACVLLFQLLAQLIRGHMLLQLRTNLDTKMTLGFIDYLVALPYSFFQSRSAGDLMMRVSSNANIREILTSNTLSGVLDGALALAYLVLIFAISPSLGAISLFLAGLQAILLVASSAKIRDLMSRELDAQARSQSYLAEMMGGMESLKVAGAEHRAVEHWSNLFVDELNVSLERGRLSTLIDGLKDLVQGASPLILLSYGAVQVVEGTVSLGTMLALTALAIGFLGPIGTLVTNTLQIQTLKSYVDRLDDVLRAEPEQNRETVARPPKLSGRIELDKVSFRYGPRAPFVIRDVSLTVEPGKTVAIVGRSGSGKTTLANLMLGLYRPTDGTLLYDGFDLAQLDVREVRKQIGIVTQRPYVFAGSIRDNISMNDPRITLNEVIEAAQLACLHEEISAMPMGYDTVVSDGGSSLSGGQRQRIAIARALVHKPAVLLLDEATSALDSATEHAVSRNLDRLEATRIVIAHRLSTIVHADEILVIDRGRVAEAGTHRELLEARGAYRELIAAQADLVEVKL